MKFLTQAQFTECWKLQDELNSVITADWKEQGYNWNLYIKAEIMEFFEYIGYKHWKEPDQIKKPSDMQARLELVDIWHFLLSHMIESCDWPAPWEELQDWIYDKKELTRPNGQRIQQLDSATKDFKGKVLALADGLQFCEWTWDELYKAYIGKVALNNFRQANGYKEGTYQKIWQIDKDPATFTIFDREDNYFLESILQELSLTEGALTYQAVYAKLGIEYMLRCDPPVTIQD